MRQSTFEKVERYFDQLAKHELWKDLWEHCRAMRIVCINEDMAKHHISEDLRKMNALLEPLIIFVRDVYDRNQEPEKIPTKREIQLYLAKLEIQEAKK